MKQQQQQQQAEEGWASRRGVGRQLGPRCDTRKAVRLELGCLPQADAHVGKFSQCQVEF